MFYCDKCAEELNWPESMAKSAGKCEMCNKTAVCNDIPSSLLPKPKTFVEEIVDHFNEGCPLTLVVVADEKELIELRHQVLKALPVLALRTVHTTARDYTWPDQNIKFAIVGEVFSEDEASTFWTQKACDKSESHFQLNKRGLPVALVQN